MKFIKFLGGIGLIFPCVVATQVLWGLLLAVQPEAGILLPKSAIALISGFLIWILFFALFPRPLRSYVLAHELSHALWGLMMGASVTKLRVRATHGSVTLSKTNFLITLAPYFFPLYTVLVILTYYILRLFYPVEGYEWLWLGLVGFTWGFHFTFTINALLQHQTDIQQQGYLFSYTVIYLANLIGICLWIMLVTPANLHEAARLTARHSQQTATSIQQRVQRYSLIVEAARERVTE